MQNVFDLCVLGQDFIQESDQQALVVDVCKDRLEARILAKVDKDAFVYQFLSFAILFHSSILLKIRTTNI